MPQMIHRQETAKAADVFFTCDFRHSVRGHLRPGAACRLHYDPLRMPLEPGYRHGTMDQPITAYVQFAEGGEIIEIPLHSPMGVLEEVDLDPSGQGSMMEGRVAVPDNAVKLIIWFTYRGASGRLHYDSNQGANYHFRFTFDDIRVVEAKITGTGNGPSAFLALEIAAESDITNVAAICCPMIRGMAGTPERVPLHHTGREETGRHIVWKASQVPIPFGASIVFEIAYEAEGRPFLDDNSGDRFIVYPPRD